MLGSVVAGLVVSGKQENIPYLNIIYPCVTLVKNFYLMSKSIILIEFPSLLPKLREHFLPFVNAESIGCLVEDRAFSPLLASAPPPPPPPALPSASCFSVSFLCIAGRAYWAGEGVDEEPNHTTEKKPGPLYIVQYFLHENIFKNCLNYQ